MLYKRVEHVCCSSWPICRPFRCGSNSCSLPRGRSGRMLYVCDLYRVLYLCDVYLYAILLLLEQLSLTWLHWQTVVRVWCTRVGCTVVVRAAGDDAAGAAECRTCVMYLVCCGLLGVCNMLCICKCTLACCTIKHSSSSWSWRGWSDRMLRCTSCVVQVW